MKSNKNQSKNCSVEQGNKVEPVREEVIGAAHGEQNDCEALNWTECQEMRHTDEGTHCVSEACEQQARKNSGENSMPR